MIWPVVLRLAFMAMAARGEPLARMTEARAAYLGENIAAVTDDPRRAAALAVIWVREGGADPRVERCEVSTPTGLGGPQLNPKYWSPVIACGHPIVSSYAALDVLDANRFDDDPARGLRRYLGATSPHHPEAKHRLALWNATLDAIECRCSR